MFAFFLPFGSCRDAISARVWLSRRRGMSFVCTVCANTVDPMRGQECADVFKRQLRRILAAPIGQRRADRLSRFVAGDIVAAEAAVTAQRSTSHIFKLPL